MRRRAITCLAAVSVGLVWVGQAVGADGTRPQHREWMRKLEPPGGTFPNSPAMLTQHDDTAALVPSGTAAQHRLWIRKLETPNGTLAFPM